MIIYLLKILQTPNATVFPYTTLFRSVGFAFEYRQAVPVRAQAAGKQCVAVVEQRSEEHTSELQSRGHIVCRLLLDKKKKSDCGRGVIEEMQEQGGIKQIYTAVQTSDA